jgi:hypothetical protein
MNNQDFTISFNVEQTPQQVFKAINNVRGWWGQGIEGESKNVGDEFIYRHGDIHYSKHRVTESIPNKKVSWLTLDGSINFVEDKTEWNNTEAVFTISEDGGKTKLQFTHHGLQPILQCYNGCSGGWTYYIVESLKKLIETGEGCPDPK